MLLAYMGSTSFTLYSVNQVKCQETAVDAAPRAAECYWLVVRI